MNDQFSSDFAALLRQHGATLVEHYDEEYGFAYSIKIGEAETPFDRDVFKSLELLGVTEKRHNYDEPAPEPILAPDGYMPIDGELVEDTEENRKLHGIVQITQEMLFNDGFKFNSQTTAE